MSSSAKSQGKANSSALLFQQAQRNLSKRDFKQALKDARVCYRQSPTPEHRELLEQASLGRARELDLSGLKPQAQDILQELLTQPILKAEIRREIPEVLSRLGMLERYPEYRDRLDADPELKAKLMVRGADMAVLRLSEAKSAAPEIRHGAALVLAALDKLDAGQDAEGVELLKDIGRQSPFADWRLFVRGLVAYYRNEVDQCEANWSRLDSTRIPARLARLVKAIRQSDTTLPADPNLANAFGALEAGLWGAPLLSDMRHLKARAAAGEWMKAASVLRNMRDRLRVVDPTALADITSYLVSQAIGTWNRELLKELANCTDPRPWDPNWNQARALLASSDREAMPQEELGYWRKYFADLNQVRCWSAEEVQLAKALVQFKISFVFFEFIEPPEPNSPPESDYVFEPEFDAECEQCDWNGDEIPPNNYFIWHAKNALKLSLSLRPDLLETHIAFCRVCEQAGNFQQAVEARIELLARFPDHLESLQSLGRYYQLGGQLEQALVYAEKLLQAKPLDEGIRRSAARIRIDLARKSMFERDHTAARQHLELSAALVATDAELKYQWHAYRAILEHLNGTVHEVESQLKLAEQNAGGTLPVLFVLTTAAIQLNLPKDLQRSYEAEWLNGLEGPFDSVAAGYMAAFGLDLRASRADYVGYVKHTTALTNYLKHGKKLSFDLKPLKKVCQFLTGMKGCKTILEYYLKYGRGRFRDSGFFSASLAMINFQLGPKKCDPDYTLQLFRDAQTKIINSNDPDETKLLHLIQEKIAFLEDLEDLHDQYDEEFGFKADAPELGHKNQKVGDFNLDRFRMLYFEEIEWQLTSRLGKKKVENLSFKEFSRLINPSMFEEIIENLATETGLSTDKVAALIEEINLSK